MQFDPDNHVVKLCAQGMALEGEENEKALQLFMQAWNEAINDFEKFIAAHYVARHQASIQDKLKWDETALGLALEIKDQAMEGSYASLYLNVAKCYEDLEDMDKAKKNYDLALSFTGSLADDGYGNMIRSGIARGIERLQSL